MMKAEEEEIAAHGGVTGAILLHLYEFHFHKCYGVGTGPNIKLNWHQSAT